MTVSHGEGQVFSLFCFAIIVFIFPFESNSTLIAAEAPGAIGSLGHSGTVHEWYEGKVFAHVAHFPG